jgi:PAS domain S-box-containing protein
LIISALVTYVVVGLISLSFHDWSTVAAVGSGCGLLLLPFLLIRGKKHKAGSLSLMVIVLASITAAATVGQGIRDLSMVAYPIVLIYAGLTSDRSILGLCGGLTFIALLWLAFGQAFGVFTTVPLFHDPYNLFYLLVLTVLLVVTVVAVDLLSANLRKSLEQSRQEIEERRRVEAALSDSNELFSHFLFHSPISAYVKEVTPTTSRFIHASGDLGEMTERPSSNAVGRALLETFPARLAASMIADDWATYSEGKVVRFAEELNDRHYVSIKFPIPVKDKNYLAGYSIDITELTQAEEALKQSEAKLRAIVEQSKDGMVVTDEKGIVIEWNDAQQAITGKNRSDVIGLPAWEVELGSLPEEMRTPDQLERFRTLVSNLLRGESPDQKFEHTIAMKDGTLRTVSERVFPIKQTSGNMLVSIVSDITEQKKEEAQKALVDQYLQQAQRLESLGVLAGGIAHDFNNILMGVFGFTDLARNEIKEGLAAEYLSQAMLSMERAKALTQQLLTFSKGGTPQKKVTLMTSLLKETCQFAMHGSNIKCDYLIEENLWTSNVDRNQIGQVIQNIVINAQQAMPLGGVIEVAARNAVVEGHPVLTSGKYVLISIRDQGIGISQGMISRIFDPFFTTKSEGHGLGLAISYSIISKHGGTINVASELGKGTVFEICLPACEGCQLDPEDALRSVHKGSGRILVMDDEEPVRELISRMLETLGYSVVVRENGKDAIEFFMEEMDRGRKFAALILDLTIPGGIGGKEVAREIRKVDKEVPLFVSSGYAGDSIIARPQEHGFTAGISKPFGLDALTAMLDRHMRLKPQAS